MNHITRQKFIKLLAAGGASFLGLSYPAWARELTRGPACPWARLKFTCRNGDDDDWNVHPNGDLNLIDAIRDQSSTNVTKQWNVAEVAKIETMTQFPFLFMHAEMAPALNDAQRANIREYLLRGGFLFAEDCVKGKLRGDGTGDEFFRRMAEVEFPKIFPEAKLERLPNDHPVFHCYYQFANGLPHMQGTPHGLHGITHNGRLLALLSPSDIHCGWTNGDTWFGTQKRIEALQMGINIYLHAMTDARGAAPRPMTDEPAMKLLSK